MIAFIVDQPVIHGVEPICKVLPIAPSTYYERVAQRRDPLRLSARARRDLALRVAGTGQLSMASATDSALIWAVGVAATAAI